MVKNNFHYLVRKQIKLCSKVMDWNEVKPLIEAAVIQVTDVKFIIYPPTGSPALEENSKRNS